MFRDFPTFSRICIFFLLTLSLLIFSLLIFLFSLPLPCSAFHLSILSGVWLLNFLRSFSWFKLNFIHYANQLTWPIKTLIHSISYSISLFIIGINWPLISINSIDLTISGRTNQWTFQTALSGASAIWSGCSQRSNGSTCAAGASGARATRAGHGRGSRTTVEMLEFSYGIS